MTLDLMTIITPIIIAAVPVAVLFIKKLIPTSLTWVIPILATVLGGVADATVAWAASRPASPMTAIMTGLAAVGLREIVDQLKKTT
ncbi:MAG: hypothetical protein A3J75_00150 [Acidobacteria bacterium RBG_16_68_9]|nr:MAG: hypothetical protein A3J75_00150 [Acidobacteria bacterium RBG_16_68_9]